MGHDLVVEVEEIKGTCPVYGHGDRMVFLEGYRLDLSVTDALCSHAMGVLLPWLAALSEGVEPQQLGLARKGDTDAHVQCPDPGGERTGGGTVLFRIKRHKP
jgi:uncharacterized repeat protein (TIGR04076 family)